MQQDFPSLRPCETQDNYVMSIEKDDPFDGLQQNLRERERTRGQKGIIHLDNSIRMSLDTKIFQEQAETSEEYPQSVSLSSVFEHENDKIRSVVRIQIRNEIFKVVSDMNLVNLLSDQNKQKAIYSDSLTLKNLSSLPDISSKKPLRQVPENRKTSDSSAQSDATLPLPQFHNYQCLCCGSTQIVPSEERPIEMNIEANPTKPKRVITRKLSKKVTQNISDGNSNQSLTDEFKKSIIIKLPDSQELPGQNKQSTNEISPNYPQKYPTSCLSGSQKNISTYGTLPSAELLKAQDTISSFQCLEDEDSRPRKESMIRQQLQQLKIDQGNEGSQDDENQEDDNDPYEDDNEGEGEEQNNCGQFSDDAIAKTEKKNVVKNFVKAFISFVKKNPSLLCSQPEDQILSLSQQTQRLRKFEIHMKKYKFNHLFIKQLLGKSDYSQIFASFMMNKAEEWLINSQVRNKETHKKMLIFFQKSIADSNQLDKLKVLKKNKRSLPKQFADPQYQNLPAIQLPFNSKQSLDNNFSAMNFDHTFSNPQESTIIPPIFDPIISEI